MGDHYDMPSASRYMGEQSEEAQIADIDEDIRVGDYGFELFEEAYGGDAERHFLLGNHEARLDDLKQQRWRTRRPEGSWRCKKKPRELGWKVHEYQYILNIGDIALSHNMVSGVMGKAIGGVNIARQLVLKGLVSCIVGHSHVYQHAEETDRFGRKKFGLSAGCFVNKNFGKHGMRDKYAKTTHQMWWNGLFYISGLDGKGYYDRIEGITQRELWEKYGQDLDPNDYFLPGRHSP